MIAPGVKTQLLHSINDPATVFALKSIARVGMFLTDMFIVLFSVNESQILVKLLK